VIVGVYRRRNVEHVLRLLEPALGTGWRTAWWALDGTSPQLAAVTVGEGPGEKLPLLTRILERLEPTDWTVLSDDDLEFRRGSVVEFVRICEQLGFDLAQPARERGTQHAHRITKRAHLSRARLTSFVQDGPMYAVGPSWRDRLLPPPTERGMGWGVEIDWFKLHKQGCRLGIVDAFPIEHVGSPTVDYDYTEMNKRMKAELVALGHPRWAGMQETLAVWRPWQRRPSWVKRSGEQAGH
jgi:hypothetical protein